MTSGYRGLRLQNITVYDSRIPQSTTSGYHNLRLQDTTVYDLRISQSMTSGYRGTTSYLVQLCLLSPLLHGFPLSFDIFLQTIDDHHIWTSECLPTLGTQWREGEGGKKRTKGGRHSVKEGREEKGESPVIEHSMAYLASFPGLQSPNAVEGLVKLLRRMMSGRRYR